MSELLERVARAIGEAYDGYADPVDTPNNWKAAIHAARLAVEAMREPSPEMTKAPHHEADACDAQYQRDDAFAEAWRAMIDAALAEGQ